MGNSINVHSLGAQVAIILELLKNEILTVRSKAG